MRSGSAIDGGVHIAAQGGIWFTAVLGFSGLSLRDDGLALNPHMPAKWQHLAYRVQWRGHHINVEIDGANRTLTALLEEGDSMRLYIGAEPYDLHQDVPLRAGFARSK
jgi:trehalose/maltose hydrolase-like predicted phosphorylase